MESTRCAPGAGGVVLRTTTLTRDMSRRDMSRREVSAVGLQPLSPRGGVALASARDLSRARRATPGIAALVFAFASVSFSEIYGRQSELPRSSSQEFHNKNKVTWVTRLHG